MLKMFIARVIMKIFDCRETDRGIFYRLRRILMQQSILILVIQK